MITLFTTCTVPTPLRNAQHGGEREERGGQGEASTGETKKHTKKKTQTIMDKIAWKSLLGVIVGEGRRRLA